MQIKRCFGSEQQVTRIIVRWLAQALKLNIIAWWQPSTSA
jgi:hypothetical protein